MNKIKEKRTGPIDGEKGQPPFLEEERILRRVPGEILGLSAVTALASLFFFSPLTAIFILAGGAFSALSFLWLKQNISRLLLLKNGGSSSGEKGQSLFFKKALKSTLAFYILRLVLIIAVFFIIILFFSRKILAFAAGFSVVIPVFLAEALIALSRMKQWKN